MLRFLLLLLAWPGSASPEPPTAACGPEGCYAVYFQRRSFLEAWRSCRELGGNLATLKRAEEAAQVAQLLRSHAGSGGGGRGGEPAPAPPRRLFWIGLQRQPRQCSPQKPLRGFTWTTGDQETAYTHWARAAAVGSSSGHPSCSVPRCVVLDDQELEWLDGSCTVPVDGFLCRFAFRGMCPGLEPEGAEGAVSYTTPFGPAGPALRYVPFGTVAAVSCGGAGPSAVSVLCLEKEDGAVGWSKAPPLCREGPLYAHSWCEGDNGGCQQLCLDEGAGYACECHAGYYLLPDGHSCAANDACKEHPCPFGCVPLGDEGYRCQCPAGYELSGDGHQCEDLDECAESAPCEHQCENTDGSYRCRCHLGFSLSDEEPGQCADTDECQFPGVCQQMCVNYVGGFECYCTEGYELDTDGISCILVAQLTPLATAQSHPAGGGGFFQPFDIGHGWPPEDHHYLDDRLAALDPFSAFQDIPVLEDPNVIRMASPDSPSSSIPDPRVVPRMVPDTEPPDFRLAPMDWTPPPSAPHLPSLELSQSPSPFTISPSTSPTSSLLPTPTVAPQGPSGPFTNPTDPISDTHPPFAPTATLPPPNPTDLPDVKGGAAVWGVRALPPTLAPPTPTPEVEDGGQPKRDDRWLLVALLVPACVFVVIMLALGIVYCTRCGAQAKTRSVTQCYRWVISSAAGKGAPPPSSSRPSQPTTCRTSV